MPATGPVLAGGNQRLLKQIVEGASIFFIFSWKVRGCDVSKFLKEKLADRILNGLLVAQHISPCLSMTKLHHKTYAVQLPAFYKAVMHIETPQLSRCFESGVLFDGVLSIATP